MVPSGLSSEELLLTGNLLSEHRRRTHANAAFSNGSTPGITLPGVQGQEAVIRKAYASAQLDLRDTVYVEVSKVHAIPILHSLNRT